MESAPARLQNGSLGRPFDPPEVWSAGATYNKDLSQASENYVRIYQAERPMLFFKATPQRCIGPFEQTCDWCNEL